MSCILKKTHDIARRREERMLFCFRRELAIYSHIVANMRTSIAYLYFCIYELIFKG